MSPLQKVIISGNGPFGDISIILNSLMLRHHRGSKNKNIIQNLPFSDDPHFPEWTHNSWLEIWQQDLNRVYSADFEIYGEKAQNPQDVEVEILVAINE